MLFWNSPAYRVPRGGRGGGRCRRQVPLSPHCPLVLPAPSRPPGPRGISFFDAEKTSTDAGPAAVPTTSDPLCWRRSKPPVFRS